MPTKKTIPASRESVKTAIKNLKNIKYRPTGVWGLKIETTKRTPVYLVSYDVGKWCMDRDFPLPKNEDEESKIEGLSDFRHFILKRDIKNFINDFLDILVAERAILFYLGVAIGIIISFSFYHYFF